MSPSFSFFVFRVGSAPHKGPISRDYEREFPSVEVGPRQVLKRSGHARTSLASVRMDSEVCPFRVKL